MGTYFLGVDVGTFETKGVLIDDHWKVAASCGVKHDMENPRPGFFEQDAEEIWWKDFCRVSKELLAQTGIRPEEIAGIGCDVLGCDCLPVDEHCRPLRKAILYGIDARASEEIAWLNDYYGKERVKELFGHPLCSDDVAPKILWVRRHEPEVYAKTCKFLTGSSYMAAKLTGRYTIDRFLANASFKPLYREDGSINEEECHVICRPDQLAETCVVHQVVGGVTEEAAEETGLAAGTPVICGTGDSTSEAISVGLTEPGKLMFQFGSSLFFYYCADRLIYDDRIYGGGFTVPGLYSVSGGTNTAGTLTRWLRDTMYRDLLKTQEESGRECYESMMEEAGAVPAGSNGLIVLPYFAGERCPVNDPLAKGMVFGLTLAHDRRHIYHAALEGIAYGIAQNIRIIEEKGLPVDSVIAVGGGTKNHLWMQITADVTGKQVQIPEVAIGGSYGEALMAALGTGYLENFKQLGQVIRIRETILPREKEHGLYQRYIRLYERLYEQNRALMHELGEAVL